MNLTNHGTVSPTREATYTATFLTFEMGLLVLGFHPFIVFLLYGLCSKRKWKERGEGSSNAAAENISLESSSLPCSAGKPVTHTPSYPPLKVLLKTKLHLLWQRSGMLKDKTSAPLLLGRSVSLHHRALKDHFPQKLFLSSRLLNPNFKRDSRATFQFGRRLKKWVFKSSANGAPRNQILKKKHTAKFRELSLLSRPDKKHLILCSHPHWIHLSFAIKLYGSGVSHPAALVLSRTISWAGKS